MLITAFIAALVAAPLEVDAVVQARTQSGFFRNQPNQQAGPRTNLYFNPGLNVLTKSQSKNFRLDYRANMFTASDDPTNLNIQHSLQGSGSATWNSRTSSSLTLSATRGELNFNSFASTAALSGVDAGQFDPGQDGGLLNTTPDQRTTDFTRASVNGATTRLLSRTTRWITRVRAAFTKIDEKVDFTLNSLRPQQRAYMSQGLMFSSRPGLRWGIEIEGGVAMFEAGSLFYQATPALVWNIGPPESELSVSFEVGGQVYVEREFEAKDLEEPQWITMARVNASRNGAAPFGKRVTYRVVGGLIPFVDPFLGNIDPRTQLQLSAESELIRGVVVRLSHQVSSPLGVERGFVTRGRRDIVAATFGAQVSFAVSQNLRLQIGGRASTRYRLEEDRSVVIDGLPTPPVDAFRNDFSLITSLIGGFGLYDGAF